ncbi:MAG: tyrosine-type recombinase/integrase [Oligoflexales bacterium]
MAVHKRGKGWRAEVFVNSKRVKSRSGFSTKRLAQKWHDETATLFRNEKSASKVKDTTYSFDDLVDRYLSNHLPTIRASTQERYIGEINYRIRPYFSYVKLNEVTPDLIEQFRVELLRGKYSSKLNSGKGNLSAKSINNCMDLLRSILNKGVKWKMIEKSPFDLERLKIQRAKYDWWENQKDIDAFLNEARKSPYYCIFLLALETGARLAECIGLSKKDVSFDRNQIHIHRQWLDKEKRYGDTKHNMERFIGFNKDSELRQVLMETIRKSPHEEAIFVSGTGNRVGARKVSGYHFENIVRKAKVPRIRFHDLRHTFASRYMINVGDIWSLMGILGHSNIKTTMRYAHLSSNVSRVPSVIKVEKL